MAGHDEMGEGGFMRKRIFAAMAVLLSNAAFADNTVATPADNGKTFDLKVGQCLDVRLETQSASTGYEWYLAPGMSERMSLAARTVTTPGNAPPGAPSQLDYILCAAAPGATTVKFLNYRVWEKNTPPAKTLSFPVKITP
jgi:predicted secreted protein